MRFIDFLFVAFLLVVGLGLPSVAFSADGISAQLFLDRFDFSRRRHQENDSSFSGKLVSSSGVLLLRFRGGRTVTGSGYSVVTHEIEWTAEPAFRPFLVESLREVSSLLPEDGPREEGGDKIQWSDVRSHLADLDFKRSSDLAIVAELNLISEMVLSLTKQASDSAVAEMGYLHRLFALWLGGFTQQDFFRISLDNPRLTLPPLALEVLSVNATGVGLQSGKVQFVFRGAALEQWRSILNRQAALRGSLRSFAGTGKPICSDALLRVGKTLYPDLVSFWKRLLRFP